MHNQDGTYTLTFRNGGRKEFDSSGRLISRVDTDGNATHYEYTSGKISKITDPLGRETDFHYDGDLIDYITDAFDRVTTLTTPTIN